MACIFWAKKHEAVHFVFSNQSKTDLCFTDFHILPICSPCFLYGHKWFFCFVKLELIDCPQISMARRRTFFFPTEKRHVPGRSTNSRAKATLGSQGGGGWFLTFGGQMSRSRILVAACSQDPLVAFFPWWDMIGHYPFYNIVLQATRQTFAHRQKPKTPSLSYQEASVVVTSAAAFSSSENLAEGCLRVFPPSR